MSAGQGNAPCGCHGRAGGDERRSEPEIGTMQEGSWQNVVMGADTPGMQARGTLKHSGPFLHAYLKFRLPRDERVYMLHASIDLQQIEDALEQEILERPGIERAVSGGERVVVGGKIGRKIKEKLKKAAKKIAKSKLVKGIIKVAKKAWNNPLVKGLISATPMGAAMVATAAAARVAAKAIKGSIKAKKALQSIAQRAKRGDPGAIKAARLVKQGVKLTGIASQLKLPQHAAAGGEGEYLAAVLGACIGCAEPVNVPPLVGCGADVSDDQEIDALETVATSGAFEGIRWLANRLRLHALNPADFDKHDAMYLGHQTMVQNALMH